MSDIDQASAIRLAVLENEVLHLRRDSTRNTEMYATLDAKMDSVLSIMSEARGSWKTLLLMGGAAGSLGGLVTWIVSHIGSK